MDAKMKKADWITYASELERKLKKAEAEIERIRTRQADDVRAEIRSEERKEWVETGLQHDASRNPTGFSPWEECERPNNFTKKLLDFP